MFKEIAMKMLFASTVILLFLAACSMDTASLTAEKTVGVIEPVQRFDHAMPTGVTVSSTGRIFVNFPQWGDQSPYAVAEVKNGELVPYPDAITSGWNPVHPQATLQSVQSVVVDAKDRLWILDTGAPGFAQPNPQSAKLMAVDLTTDKVVKTISIAAPALLKTTYLNDVRFDLGRGKEGFAYITDSSNAGIGGIIVVDLASGKSWRHLTGHKSTMPDKDFIPVVEGQPLLKRDAAGKTSHLQVASDGIELSPDGTTLYYSPLSSRHLYSVPTALLRNPATPQASLANAVRDLGDKGASDGLAIDAKGRVYASDYEHNSIHQLQTDGTWRTVAHDPRMLWPDTLSMGPDGYLYFIANQLHRQNWFHAQDERVKPFMLYRVRID
jgi:sugar lactone lactonase YvrE